MIRIVLEYPVSDPGAVKRLFQDVEDILNDAGMDTPRMTAEYVDEESRITSGKR